MKAIQIIIFCLVFPVLAFAHGGADHSHDDAPAASASVSAQPRIETATEIFEIVGRLENNELSLLIDRFATNEPVLNGNVEVEVNGQKAAAKFHADHGDYSVSDQAFIKALAKPGKHVLMLTVSAGDDTDLLETTMTVGGETYATADGKTGLRHVPLSTAAIIGGILALVLAAIAIVLARRKPSTGN
ncbi:hypothetical protein [Noviherbaspirillum aerium]|uniref:hypothetical protein n=1 Tax=Noviherbaspirillum aerium TaxID=2588497 RepID=UPI00124DA069|nr:hypothetical protein [Noviherbaspirillum aerium]